LLDEIRPEPADVVGFDAFMQRRFQARPVQQEAAERTQKAVIRRA
jgi:hypothetical protein